MDLVQYKVGLNAKMEIEFSEITILFLLQKVHGVADPFFHSSDGPDLKTFTNLDPNPFYGRILVLNQN